MSIMCNALHTCNKPDTCWTALVHSVTALLPGSAGAGRGQSETLLHSRKVLNKPVEETSFT